MTNLENKTVSSFLLKSKTTTEEKRYLIFDSKTEILILSRYQEESCKFYFYKINNTQIIPIGKKKFKNQPKIKKLIISSSENQSLELILIGESVFSGFRFDFKFKNKTNSENGLFTK